MTEDKISLMFSIIFINNIYSFCCFFHSFVCKGKGCKDKGCKDKGCKDKGCKDKGCKDKGCKGKG